jgi:hypothetical protein
MQNGKKVLDVSSFVVRLCGMGYTLLTILPWGSLTWKKVIKDLAVLNDGEKFGERYPYGNMVRRGVVIS